MSKHSARIEKLSHRERRHRTVARLANGIVAERHEASAKKSAEEISVLERSTQKRAREHRGERPAPKSAKLAEFEQLRLRLQHMPDIIRRAADPHEAIDETNRLAVKIANLANELNAGNHHVEFWLIDVAEAIRVRTENEPTEVARRANTISNHANRRHRGQHACWCSVCRCVANGTMSADGRYIERKKRSK